jgi:hypothetical protein
MPLYTFSYNLLNVLVQIANKIRLQKNCEWGIRITRLPERLEDQPQKNNPRNPIRRNSRTGPIGSDNKKKCVTSFLRQLREDENMNKIRFTSKFQWMHMYIWNSNYPWWATCLSCACITYFMFWALTAFDTWSWNPSEIVRTAHYVSKIIITQQLSETQKYPHYNGIRIYFTAIEPSVRS